MHGTIEWAHEFNCTATFAGMSPNGHRMYTFDGEWPDVNELLLEYFDGDEDEAWQAIKWDEA